MTKAQPPTWSRVKAILGEALEVESAEREAFLDRVCAGEPALRRRVAELVSAYSRSEGLSDADSPARVLGALFEPRVGSYVGRYRIVRLIGRGGMGSVYEAVDEQLSRPVAVKVVQAGIASRALLKRFELESRLLARLRHPAIAHVFEAGTVKAPGAPDPMPYFAMELIAGATPIVDYAVQKGLPLEERLTLFVRVCEGVTHGHQRSVIHRDLKPANILVDASGQPKIIDFGVARATDPGAAATTLAGELLGTLRYMSPEQLGAEGIAPEDLDVRTDVYSLGVVLYELLSGQPPCPDPEGGVVGSIRGAAQRTPAPLSKLAAALKGDIETVALKAVCPDRGARYQSVAELAADIERVLRHEPISARPLSAAYQARMFARRHRALVTGLAGVFLALALGVVGTSVGLVHARRAEATATAQAHRAQRLAGFLENTIRAADPMALPPETLARLDIATYPNEAWFLPRAGWGSAGPAEVGVAGVLRHAADHLEADFGDDPELLAEVSVLLAYTLGTLEDSATAGRLLKQALTIQTGILEADDERIIRTRMLYAQMLNHGPEAGVQLGLALDSARRRFGAMDSRTLLLSDQAAMNLGYEWKFEEALAMAQASIQGVSAAQGADSAAAWMRHVTLIDLMALQAKPETRAERIAECRATIAGLTRAVGPDYAPMSHLSWRLATELEDDPATLPEAGALRRRALEIQVRLLGRDSKGAYDMRAALIAFLMRERKLGEAEALAREGLESSLRMIGASSTYTIKAEGRLARILTWEEREAEEAERLGKLAAEGAEAAYGATEDYATYHLAIWAAAVRQRHHPEQAEAMLRARLALRGERPLQHNSSWVEAYVYLQLSLCLRDQGRMEEARAAMRTARAWGEAMNDPLNSEMLNIVEEQARMEGGR